MGTVQRGAAVNRVIGYGAFVESHDNIRTKLLLDMDGTFRGKAVHGAVDVAFESHTIVIYLARI